MVDRSARAAVEVGPGAVVPLLGPDPAACRRDRRVVVQAEELAQQQVLGVHGHVGLELALPPPLGVLQAEQVVASPVQGPASQALYHVRAVMNSAIAVSSARTLRRAAGRCSARLALAAASCASASDSAQSLPPAATTRLAARTRSCLGQRLGAGEQGAQLGRLSRAAVQRGHHRQRLLPGAQVGTNRLAGDLGRTPDAEQVVGELERQPDMRAEPGQAHGQRGRRAQVHRADAAGARHQRGGLVPGHVQALGQGYVVALLEGQVRALSADQPQHRRGHTAGRPRALEGVVLEQQVLGQREQRVPGQDGRADAEHGPGRRAVPALGVVVHQIVVQQGEVVHQLDGDRTGDCDASVHTGGSGGEQGEGGPERLAAAAGLRSALHTGPAEVVRGLGPGGPGRAGPPASRRAGWTSCWVSERATREGDKRHARLPSVVVTAKTFSPCAEECGRGRLPAADRTLHGRGPAGVGPGAGEQEPGIEVTGPGLRAPLPGDGRNVASRSRVTKKSCTNACRVRGRSAASDAERRSRRTAAGRWIRSSAADRGSVTACPWPESPTCSVQSKTQGTRDSRAATYGSSITRRS